MMGWKATCNFVTTRYRDKFTGDGIEQIPSGYILKGQKQGLPEDEWGWQPGGAAYQRHGGEVIVFSHTRAKILKTLSPKQQEDFIECYKDTDGVEAQIVRELLDPLRDFKNMSRKDATKLIIEQYGEPQPPPEPETKSEEPELVDDDYQERLNRANRLCREWVERLNRAREWVRRHAQSESEKERFDNYVEYGVDATDAGMVEE